MDDIRIRRAMPADADIIAAFNLALAEETEHRRLDPAVVGRGVRRLLADPSHGVYYVAELDGRVVGQLLITYEFSDWRDGVFWWIQSVYVDPSARRRGVYRALHTYVEREARQDGRVCGLRLYVDKYNYAAQEVYAKHGLLRTDYRVFEKDWGGQPGAGPPQPPRGLEIDFRCKFCGYNLRGLLGGTLLRCPECGQDSLAPER